MLQAIPHKQIGGLGLRARDAFLQQLAGHRRSQRVFPKIGTVEFGAAGFPCRCFSSRKPDTQIAHLPKPRMTRLINVRNAPAETIGGGVTSRSTFEVKTESALITLTSSFTEEC
jgi:hypothetical protein